MHTPPLHNNAHSPGIPCHSPFHYLSPFTWVVMSLLYPPLSSDTIFYEEVVLRRHRFQPCSGIPCRYNDYIFYDFLRTVLVFFFMTLSYVV